MIRKPEFCAVVVIMAVVGAFWVGLERDAIYERNAAEAARLEREEIAADATYKAAVEEALAGYYTSPTSSTMMPYQPASDVPVIVVSSSVPPTKAEVVDADGNPVEGVELIVISEPPVPPVNREDYDLQLLPAISLEELKEGGSTYPVPAPTAP